MSRSALLASLFSRRVVMLALPVALALTGVGLLISALAPAYAQAGSAPEAPSNANDPFVLTWSSLAADGTSGGAWADYDGDGDLDLLAGNYGYPKSLYRNTGGVLDTTPVWASTDSDKTVSVAWGDVDNDGDLDLVTGNDQQPLHLYRTTGGVLSAGPVYTSTLSDPLLSVAWGDVDNDGDLDLAVGTNYSQKVKLYRNTGTTLAATPFYTSTPGSFNNALAWGDYDGDGDIDLAVGNGGVDWVFNNTGGTLTANPVYSTTESNTSADIAWVDYDGDGDLDLATGNASGPLLLVYRNDNGTLTASAVYSSTESGVGGDLAVGDYDNDGDPDILVSGGSNSPARLYRNDMGVFTPSSVWDFPVTDSTGDLAFGDVDNDGDLDLAVFNYGPERLYLNTAGTIPTSASWSSTTSDASASVAWGDVDGDGDLDLAVGNHNQPNKLYRNEGGILSLFPVYTTTESDETTGVAWGDVDGDGDLDLAVSNNNNQKSRLYRNDAGILTASAVWSTTETSRSNALAWADYDNDGDLDLAFANGDSSIAEPARLYRNNAGTLTTSAVWSSTPFHRANSLAWGDVDNDGDLDLALGIGGTYNPVCSCIVSTPNVLYRNDAGTLTANPVYSTTEADDTRAVAWADYDNDGDLDLAVANVQQPNRLYRNDNGVLTASAVWSSVEADYSTSLAWGDYDNDGDLDLAVGNSNQPNQLYRNDEGVLTEQAVWSSTETDQTYGLAWGDVDGDGDLDLALANGGNFANQPERLHLNQRDARFGSAPVPVMKVLRPTPPGNADFYSAPRLFQNVVPITYTLFDEDGSPVKAVYGYYSPDGGGQWFPATPTSATVTTNLTPRQQNDFSATGDVALINGGVVTGTLNVSGITQVTDVDVWLSITHTLDSDVRVVLQSPNGLTVTLFSAVGGAGQNFANTLFDDEASTSIVSGTAPFSGRFRPVENLVDFDGLTGSNVNGTWRLRVEDTAGGGSGTLDAWGLQIQSNNGTYVYNWDVGASGFFGQSDNMIFRLVAIPQVVSQTTHLPGPYRFGSYGSQTYPFRVRGTQVRVMNGASPAANAIVYRLAAGQTTGGALLSDVAGAPFLTDGQGYLQGRGQVAIGDQLLALYPMTSTETYTLYRTNGTPTATGLTAHTVSTSGVQTLTVSANNPLHLFTVYVSLEWDSAQDPSYLEQLQFNLQRASEYLYDFTNGQAALGNVVVEQNADDWGFANVLIHANNRLRPFAAQGGIVTTETVDFNPVLSDVVYAPGQVHMGATWNRYGTPGTTLGDDWAITLAHELGHYLFFLDDVYLGLDAQGFLVPVDTCIGSAMGDLYSDPNNTELIANEAFWQANCAETLTEQTLQRNEWETMDGWYTGLVTPSVINAGPSLMPFDFTAVDVLAPLTPTNALVDPTFYLNYAGGGASSNESRAYLIRDGQYIIDLGSPFGGQNRVKAWGAKPTDRLCIFDRPRQQFGCEVLAEGDDQLQMKQDVNWNPLVQVTPVNSTTLILQVDTTGAVITQAVQARLFPEYGPGTITRTLTLVGSTYSGTITLTAPALNGQIQIWVNETATETNPRRETMVAYSVGGNPGPTYGSGSYRAGGGSYRAGGGSYRAGGGSYRAGGAPIISPDGQMIFFTENPIIFDEGEFFTIQGMAALPSVPPGRTVIGAGYRLVATPGTPVITGSVSIQYLSNDVTVAGASEDGLSIYFNDGSTWTELPTTRSPYFNLVTAPSQGVGVYALMASIQIALPSAGWNLFAYPIQGSQPITDALLSISGYYTTVYGYDPTDLLDPWKVYDIGVPPYVNTLLALEFGQGYWINVSQPITLYLGQGGTTAPESLQTFASPPSTFYGVVSGDGTFTPAPGQTVIARINGKVCGQGLTLDYGGQVVYVVDVSGDANCGVAGALVTFEVAGQPMAQIAWWDNLQLWNINLSPGVIQQLFLPLVGR